MADARKIGRLHREVQSQSNRTSCELTNWSAPPSCGKELKAPLTRPPILIKRQRLRQNTRQRPRQLHIDLTGIVVPPRVPLRRGVDRTEDRHARAEGLLLEVGDGIFGVGMGARRGVVVPFVVSGEEGSGAGGRRGVHGVRGGAASGEGGGEVVGSAGRG